MSVIGSPKDMVIMIEKVVIMTESEDTLDVGVPILPNRGINLLL